MTIRWGKPQSIGLAVTLAVVGACWIMVGLPDHSSGAREDSYASQVAITSPSVSAAESMMAGGVVYYDGTLENRGDKTLAGFTAELTFTDINGKPLLRVQRILLDGRQKPVPPHATRSFEIGFDKVPAGWNQAPPTPRPAAVFVR